MPIRAANKRLRNGTPVAFLESVGEEREARMTLKIERVSHPSGTTIRLIGRMQIEHLQELEAQLELSRPKVTLDLEQMSLVDVEAIRFLGKCEALGIEIARCSQYIRDWIDSEVDPDR